eukprot:GABV01010814.1.p1 GENE.GABV01010814.1~~GABV01010814.1.p1  ORF type:complete len:107 (-),score=31.27 GABV01010814.1:49-369(-)
MSNDSMTLMLTFLPLHSRLTLRTASETFHAKIDRLNLTQTTLTVTLRPPKPSDADLVFGGGTANKLLDTIKICSRLDAFFSALVTVILVDWFFPSKNGIEVFHISH